MNILSIQNLKKTFQTKHTEEEVLSGLDLEITRGDITALVGPSGSGKSTLMTIAAGLQNATSGAIYFKDKDLKQLKSNQVRDVRASSFGFVFQHAHLVPFLNIQDQLELMMDTAGVQWDKSERQKRIDEVLERIDMVKHKKSYPDQLSGGEKQRIAIARAIIHKPELLFADEPTASLDSKRSIEVMELIRELCKDEDITVLMVTHDTDMLKYADRVVEMKDGLIQE